MEGGSGSCDKPWMSREGKWYDAYTHQTPTDLLSSSCSSCMVPVSSAGLLVNAAFGKYWKLHFSTMMEIHFLLVSHSVDGTARYCHFYPGSRLHGLRLPRQVCMDYFLPKNLLFAPGKGGCLRKPASFRADALIWYMHTLLMCANDSYLDFWYLVIVPWVCG